MTEPQVSWMAIERGASVVVADGREVGSVDEIAGDREADIFSGLVLRLGALEKKRFLSADCVVGIWPRRVEVSVSAAEVHALAEYDEPVVERLRAGGGLFDRVRHALRRR